MQAMVYFYKIFILYKIKHQDYRRQLLSLLIPRIRQQSPHTARSINVNATNPGLTKNTKGSPTANNNTEQIRSFSKMFSTPLLLKQKVSLLEVLSGPPFEMNGYIIPHHQIDGGISGQHFRTGVLLHEILNHPAMKYFSDRDLSLLVIGEQPFYVGKLIIVADGGSMAPIHRPIMLTEAQRDSIRSVFIDSNGNHYAKSSTEEIALIKKAVEMTARIASNTYNIIEDKGGHWGNWLTYKGKPGQLNCNNITATIQSIFSFFEVNKMLKHYSFFQSKKRLEIFSEGILTLSAGYHTVPVMKNMETGESTVFEFWPYDNFSDADVMTVTKYMEQRNSSIGVAVKSHHYVPYSYPAIYQHADGNGKFDTTTINNIRPLLEQPTGAWPRVPGDKVINL